MMSRRRANTWQHKHLKIHILGKGRRNHFRVLMRGNSKLNFKMFQNRGDGH